MIQGSSRSKNNCPNEWGKTRTLAIRSTQGLPEDVVVDFLDLAVELDGASTIQPCKACPSTAGGVHCHWPCDCYGPRAAGGEGALPDLMHDQDVYRRIARADGFVLFSPINWYSVGSQVKAMFDRMVCANLTMTVDQAQEAFGDTDGKSEHSKDASLTRPASSEGTYDDMMTNHLEGKFGAFFIHGDGGADELHGRYPVPKSLQLHPDEVEWPNEPRMAIEPIVRECRYMGINVPEDLVVATVINHGLGYPEGNDAVSSNEKFFDTGRQLVERLVTYIGRKEVGFV